MPIALERDGYKFYFYSNEHQPIHVHVRNGAGRAKFDISDDVELIESQGMKVQDLRRAQNIAEEEVDVIRRKWHEYFGA